ncbi:MAG: bifunctional folylpolyglutamate synthase/dihydrofolate synthase [Sulfurimonas sp.]
MLKDFLHKKPLYYNEIDYTRMPRVYADIKANFNNPKVIHIIGTNGKGTTGRFLASALYSLGYSVGHYTSPHILKFNERIWLNGFDVSDDKLNAHHQELLMILTQEEADSLSYFEYTTLLAMLIYKDADYVVLEAGLGGEYDATAVFDNILTLVTPIAKDHEAFLGTTIKEIATTKLNAVQKMAILSQQINTEVYEVANNLKIEYEKVSYFLEKEDKKKIDEISKNLSLAPYLQNNLTLAISALKYLGVKYESSNFLNSKLFGRLTPLNDKIFIDVGHNVLAAQAILETLNGSQFTVIYNSYKDKAYKEILAILKPIIKSVEIINISDERIEKKEKIQETLKELGIVYNSFKSIDKNKKYLVFGSFSVVEEFLKVYNG